MFKYLFIFLFVIHIKAEQSVDSRFVSALGCLMKEDVWSCTREKSGKLLDFVEEQVNEKRRAWQKEADSEIASASNGRTVSSSDRPSRVGSIVELATRELLYSLGEAFYGSSEQDGARKKAGIDSITVMTSSGGHMKKKMKKKTPQFHLVPASMMMEGGMAKGSEEKDLKVGSDEEVKVEEGSEGREVGESRGKKKKKKKAILKLLILGAVLKAKLSLLLQILSFKLQVKFFLIALVGLLVNIARFWLDVKKGGTPQKVIYYEHAQHQHHYDHEDEGYGGGGGGGYWSRSLPRHGEDGAPIITEEESTEAQDLPYKSWLGRR